MQILEGEFERVDTPPPQPQKPKKEPKRNRGGWLKKTMRIIILLILLPFILVPFYAFIPPLSLPVIERAVTLQNVSWRWRSIEKISPYLAASVIAAEDGNFCNHDGIDWKALKKSFKRYEKRRAMKHGASTIPMQTAKNLFLWYLPTIARKPLEIPLAMWMDFVWSKKRTMEIYLNVAEFGKGVYGAEAAAQKYFGKSAKNLGRREAALLTAVLPSPKKRKVTNPGKYVRSYADRIKSRSYQQDVGCLK